MSALGVPLLALTLALAACGGDPPAPLWSGGSGAEAGAGATSPSPSVPAGPLSLTVTPADDAKDVPISAEIGLAVTGGTVTSVSVKDSQGAVVAGKTRADGASWVPDRPLRYRRDYTATVTATGAGGATQTKTTTFSTMGEPGRRVGTGLYLFDGATYGVAMPVVVEFDTEIPVAARAEVQRRLFVTTDPPQPGAWAWFGGRMVLYRAETYWRTGTRITARIALEGHPMGGNRFGDTDRRASATISTTRTELKVDNTGKKMAVYQNDVLVKTLPVSLGKPKTPSSSGTMVIMEKRESTVFDTRNDPDPANRYVVDIEYAQRLTWGGEFIHAAPWSEKDQGVRNVSHGCVNVSMSNAQWLFSLTTIGDPVTVAGTERTLTPGNGWTAWDLTWPEFVKRSALPVR